MNVRAKAPARIVVVAILWSGAATVADAQTSSGSQGRSGRPDSVQRELQRQYEMQAIEKALNEKRPTKSQRYPPLILEQIKSDFLGIQVIDRKLIRATSTSGSLDLAAVLRASTEIRKLSQRLKKNLNLPQPDGAERPGITVEVTTDSIKQSLPVLSKFIEDLVSNPMFERSKLIDSKLSAKAQRDLNSIIDLSGDIKNSTQKLQRTKL